MEEDLKRRQDKGQSKGVGMNYQTKKTFDDKTEDIRSEDVDRTQIQVTKLIFEFH